MPPFQGSCLEDKHQQNQGLNKQTKKQSSRKQQLQPRPKVEAGRWRIPKREDFRGEKNSIQYNIIKDM